MTNRETRKEQYEDALFALLMDEMAQEDGEELLRLNEQLKQDPGAAVPEAVQRRCEKVIGTAFSRRQFRATGRRTVRWLGRLLLAAILGVLLFTAAFAVSEDVRVATLNVLIEVMNDHTKITFEDTYSESTETPTEINPGLEYHYNIALEWIPEGFELNSGNFDEDSSSGYVSYLSPQDGMIVVSVTPYSAGLVVSLDTEDCTKRDVEVHGHPASLYIANESKVENAYHQFGMTNIWSDMIIYWIDQEAGVMVDISATNLTEEEMIRLAEGVHWRGSSDLEYHYNIALEWIPEGFELDSGNYEENGTGDYVSYLSPQDGLIEVGVTPYSTGLTKSVNTEGCTKQEVTVQGHSATLYITNEDMLESRYHQYGMTNIWSQMMIYWMDEELQVIVQVDATNLTKEEMIRLAEGVHWRGSSDLEYHYNIALEWIPEGFELESGDYEENGTSDYVSYLSPQDGMIVVSVTPYSTGLTGSLSTEDCEKKDVTVQNHLATLYITNDDMLERRYHQIGLTNIWSDMMMYWIDQDAGVIVDISATNLTEEEMVRLAEGVHWLRAPI